jgi:hypothetical protein
MVPRSGNLSADEPATTLLCRVCWHAAEVTRTEARVWCAHAVHHGWQTDRPGCDRAGFKPDDDRRP